MCLRDVVWVNREGAFKIDFQVATRQDCAVLCLDATECTGYIYNKYGECHLYRGDARRFGTAPDYKVHETISCRTGFVMVSISPLAGVGNFSSAALVPVERLVSSARGQVKSSPVQNPTHSAPLLSTPLHATPRHATPRHSTPFRST